MDETNESVRASQGDRARSQAVMHKDGEGAPIVRGGLDGGKVNRMAESLAGAIGMLSGGEAKPTLPTVQGTVDQLPPAIFSPLNAVCEFLTGASKEVPELGKYTIDAQSVASSNAGLDEGYATFGELAMDKDVAAAVKRPAPKSAAPTKAAPAAAPTDESDGLA